MKNKILLIVFFFIMASIGYSQTVYVTKTGKKYHSANCRSLSKSSIPISLAEAQAKGYEPCKVCGGGSTSTPAQTSQQKKQPNTQTDSQSNTTSSTQCKGSTKAGARCKRKTMSPNGYCSQHGGN
jgi:hypothetical protein